MQTEDLRIAPTRNAVSAWMTDYITSALAMDAAAFSPDTRFESYGLDSAELVIMAGIMEETFAIEVNPEAFFETPTVNGILDGLVAAGTIRA